MAKKKAIKEEPTDADLLGGNPVEIEVKEPEIIAVIKPNPKEYRGGNELRIPAFIGYHPITGAEVWQ